VLRDLLWAVGTIVVLVGMLIVAYRMEPHWVSRDGQRFLCNAQPLDELGNRMGRWREMRVTIMSDGRLNVAKRALVMGRANGYWELRAKSPTPPRGKVVYLLANPTEDKASDLLAIRLPAKSRAIPHLDALLAT
jgi:hypothetical protein